MGRHQNVEVSTKGLLKKLLATDKRLQEGVKTVVKTTTDDALRLADQLASKPVQRGGKKKQVVRSKPGQAPRSDTGRMRRSLLKKMSPKGYVGTVSTSNVAVDRRGFRYPFILEAGTEKIKKRPWFKKIQRKLKKPFTRAMGLVAKEAVQRANR